MSGATCFICGETYYNGKAETYIKVTRIERDGARKKTTKWGGMVCDKCIHKFFGKEGGDD